MRDRVIVWVVLVLALLCRAVSASGPVYVLSNVHDTPQGQEGSLTLQDGTVGPYGSDIPNLKLSVMFETENRLHIKITDADHARWEVPLVAQPTSFLGPNKNEQANYDISLQNNPFSFKVTRKADNAVIFDTANMPFVFEDQYISFGSWMPQNANVYGLGERVHPFRLDPSGKTYSIFTVDRGTAVDRNLYGAHPFYTEFRNGNAHGVFFLNSNAMDVLLNPGAIEFRTIGGVVDLYFFMGPQPESVIQQYQEIIGKPVLIPAWSLGNSQCRWGYATIDDVEHVIGNYSAHNLPLSVMWSDIDYMNGYRDFTTDPVRYPVPRVQQMINQLHSQGKEYVVIIDPGIKVEQGYPAYDQGLQDGIFILEPNTTNPILGQVWPGITAFPDFLTQKGRAYWKNQIQSFLSQVPVSGLWIDMNELISFLDTPCSGKIGSFDPDNPPYVPGPDPLDLRTVCMSSRTMDATQISYNTHSLYGFSESIATHDALAALKNSRPFVLSRSTFSGSGHYSAHWLGDNDATFDALAQSIPGILNFNIFGVPMVGADICGFNGPTNPELCTRWIQLGTFYTFMRMHNAISEGPKEPYALGPQVLTAAQRMFNVRMSMLPYLYTQMFRVHASGGTVLRAMWFEFPSDASDQLAYMDQQFMFGPSILVAPVLTQGDVTKSLYLPSGVWYDFWTGAPTVSTGQWFTVVAPIQSIPVYARGGHIVPKQQPAMSARLTYKNPYDLVVALDASGNADGELYVDDGDSLQTLQNGKYTHVAFQSTSSASSGTFSASIDKQGFDVSSLFIQSVTFLGAACPSGSPKAVVNGKSVAATYSADVKTLSLTGLNAPLAKSVAAKWSC
nr:lysosomal alpha-glucosidase [Andalucia godoyi]|eukprot:ANDGO_03030.mRNA.1 putative alpha-glucosidase Os06g0675700